MELGVHWTVDDAGLEPGICITEFDRGFHGLESSTRMK